MTINKQQQSTIILNQQYANNKKTASGYARSKLTINNGQYMENQLINYQQTLNSNNQQSTIKNLIVNKQQ